MNTTQLLDGYLQKQYRFDVIPDEAGGYVIEYPDLQGCMTQVETVNEVSAAAREIFELWVEAAIDSNFTIPEPTYPEEYSGRFVLRMPKSLHRRLAERAAQEGASLNQFAVALLAEGIGRLPTAARVAATPVYEMGAMPTLQMVAEEAHEYDQPASGSPKRHSSGA